MEKIALIDSEYSCLKSGLSRIHTDCLQQITIFKGQIKSLNSSGGGFEATELTKKINAVVTELLSIQTSMESAFDENEERIASFARMVNNYDSPC